MYLKLGSYYHLYKVLMGLFSALKSTYKLSQNGVQLLNSGMTELNNGLEHLNSELENWNEDLLEKKPLSDLKHTLSLIEVDLTYARKSLSENEPILDKYLSLYLDAVRIGKQYIQFGIDHKQHRKTVLKVIEQTHSHTLGVDFSKFVGDIEKFCKIIKDDPSNEELEAKDDFEHGGLVLFTQRLNQVITNLNKTVPVKISLQSTD